MKREINIDRAVYLVDDDIRSYVFLKPNPDWTNLDPEANKENKKSIDGYTRIFKNGGKKVFRFK